MKMHDETGEVIKKMDATEARKIRILFIWTGIGRKTT